MKNMKKTKNTKITRKTKMIIGVVFSAIILLLLFLLVPMNTGTNERDIIEISERMFIQQVRDIHINTSEYLGKTVRLEGIFGEVVDQAGGEPHRFVYRRTPGCCGDDGMSGFLVFLGDWPAPEPDAWVEATGEVDVIVSETNARVRFPVLRLSSLRVLETRGREVVNN